RERKPEHHFKLINMVSEVYPSASEIHIGERDVSQLKALSLNFLQNISEISNGGEVPKLSPCHKCGKQILTFSLRAFVVLSYTQTPIHPSCSICSTIIEIIREEVTLASDKYRMTPKIHSLINSEKKSSKQSENTIDDDIENTRESELVVGTSSTEQEKQTERGTSPIVIDDDSYDLLEELSVSIKDETVEAMIGEDENDKDSAPKNPSVLYQKVSCADKNNSRRNCMLVLLWEKV
ncbi:6040_t:CDS:2, partial [Acaulospora morrowiae]